MIPVLTAITSSVGKKIIMAVTAFSLVIFVIAHLIGNLQLIAGRSEAFNVYAHKLESLGGLLYAAETGLLVIFAVHIAIAVSVVIRRKMARPVGYYMSRGLGSPSRRSVGSSTMIYTGVIIVIFMVIHILHFKFGAGITDGYIKVVDGYAVRDLYRLVIEEFSNIWYVAFYSVVMLLMGLHLSHGFWSAFQSLGANHPRYTPVIFAAGLFVAAVLACGFLSIPVVIYLG